MNPSSNITLAESLRSRQRLAFYERRKDIAKIMIIVVFVLPLFGVYISGLLGAAFGTMISIVAYFLTPYAIFKLGT